MYIKRLSIILLCLLFITFHIKPVYAYDAALYIFIPGYQQIMSGYRTKGILIIIGEILSMSFSIYSNNKALNSYAEYKMLTIHDPEICFVHRCAPFILYIQPFVNERTAENKLFFGFQFSLKYFRALPLRHLGTHHLPLYPAW